MTGFSLVLSGLLRHKLRLALLLFAICVAFLAYGVIGNVGAAMNASVDLAGADRLVVTNRMSVTQPLPYAYLDRIARIPGVTHAAPAIWFGGYVRDARNEVVVVAADAEAWLDVYPEFVVPAQQRDAFLQDRTGLLVGERLAARMGWRPGDRVALRSNFWTRADGGDAWPVTVQAIFRGADARTNTDRAFMHYAYLEEGRGFWNDMVQQITIRTASSAANDQVAAAIDASFQNSSYETHTADESAVRSAMVRQVGDLNLILGAITAAAFASILMIVGNSLLMGARQRRKEFAVMRTLGFSQSRIVGQVITETALIVVTGALLGLAGAAAALGVLKEPIRALAPSLGFSANVAFAGLGFGALFSLLSSLPPALLASRGALPEILGKA